MPISRGVWAFPLADSAHPTSWTPYQAESLEHMLKLRNDLKKAEKRGNLSLGHFRKLQEAIANARDSLPPIEPPVNNSNDDDSLVKRFQHLSWSWRGPLQGMMEDPQRRQELEDMFPSLKDEKLRQLLVEAQRDCEVCSLDRMKTRGCPTGGHLSSLKGTTQKEYWVTSATGWCYYRSQHFHNTGAEAVSYHILWRLNIISRAMWLFDRALCRRICNSWRQRYRRPHLCRMTCKQKNVKPKISKTLLYHQLYYTTFWPSAWVHLARYR